MHVFYTKVYAPVEQVNMLCITNLKTLLGFCQLDASEFDYCCIWDFWRFAKSKLDLEYIALANYDIYEDRVMCGC